MIEQEQSALTPGEAGAFVAQWAEQHKIGVGELARRLDVDDQQAASLMRQAKGRLSMDQWLQDKKPGNIQSKMNWLPVLGALLVGGGLGAFLTSRFMPHELSETAPHALPLPRVTVTDPPDTNGNNGNARAAGPLAVPNPRPSEAINSADLSSGVGLKNSFRKPKQTEVSTPKSR